MLNNYEEYKNAEEKFRQYREENQTVQMLLGIEPEPEEFTKIKNEYIKETKDFECRFPYAVKELGAGRYHTIGMYATAEEAIANCPEYEAYVENIIEHKDVYRAKRYDD